jgi:hypothetical protein
MLKVCICCVLIKKCVYLYHTKTKILEIMTTLKINYKHKSQIGNGIITGVNTLVNEITGGTLSYWNRYQDERAKQILASKALEFSYGYKKAKDFVITNVEIR